MKNNLILLITLTALSCSNQPENRNQYKFNELTTIKGQNNPNYTLKGSQTGFDYEIYSNDTLSIFGLELELTSKYDSFPAIYLMTCSWGPENGLTNPPNFQIGTPCDANFWMPVQVKKDEVLELKTSVLLEEDIRLNEYELQFGLVLVDTTEVSWLELGSQASEEFIRNKQLLEKDVVWSNVMRIKKIEPTINTGGKWQLVKKAANKP